MKQRKPLQAAFQLVLDLFDFGSTPAPVSQPKPDATAPSTPKRHIRSEDRIIEFTLRRSKRRSIGFLIEDDGLRVTAPRWVSIAEIEDAIRSKHRWIITKLDQRQQRASLQQTTNTTLCDGAQLTFLGQQITLRMLESPIEEISLDEVSKVLTVTLPATPSEAQLKSLVLRWLQEEAHSLFSQRLPHYAENLGVTYSAFALSNAVTQWGSCTAQGRVRLSWRLIHFPLSIIDYVIAHELSHLREMNHSTRFWATVQSIYPDYEVARKTLRKHAPQSFPGF